MKRNPVPFIKAPSGTILFYCNPIYLNSHAYSCKMNACKLCVVCSVLGFEVSIVSEYRNIILKGKLYCRKTEWESSDACC